MSIGPFQMPDSIDRELARLEDAIADYAYDKSFDRYGGTFPDTQPLRDAIAAYLRHETLL
jgi:hypothetical protein